MREETIFSSRSTSTERQLEEGVRPASFADFIGQAQLKENLSIYIEAAKGRGEVLDHLLLSGPPGLGKTTLSRIIATAMGREIYTVQGPAVDRPADLAGILTSMKEGDVLFIDEIHRLRSNVEEYLYSAMEDFALDVVMGEGPSARTMRLRLAKFTLIGATTREGLLSKPLRSRFGMVEKLQDYPWEDLAAIARRTSGILGVRIDADAAEVLARRSRGTPRLVNRFLRRLRDVAQVRAAAGVSLAIAAEGFRMMGVDEHGLDPIDRKILDLLVNQKGQPVGVKTISTVVGESEDTIEDVYEPYLIRQGYIGKTPRGRVPFARAYELFGLAPQPPEPSLFE